MRWAEIRVDCGADREEPVSAVLSDYSSGVSITEGGRRVTAWVPVDDRLESVLNSVIERLDDIGEDRPEVTVSYAEEQDWNLAWREYFKSFETAGRFRIRPPWEEAGSREDIIDIVIDPGMAFGTGQHPTTEMMLQALAEYPPRLSKILDMGSGSAILAIAAAKLGAESVTAVEVDPVAEENALRNIQLNGVQSTVRYMVQNGAKGLGGGFDYVLMNIVADVILRLLGEVSEVMTEGATLACSGIIDHRFEEVSEALTNAGFMIRKVYQSGDWRCVVCEKA